MTPPTDPRSVLARRQFLGRVAVLLASAATLGRVKWAEAGPQGTEPFLGEILLFAAAFAPKGWALCNGQLLPINQNQALFSLLGTQYGGNGQTNFALPDLRGCVPIHHGQGPGLSPRTIGGRAGAEHHTLTIAEIPAHSHALRASSAQGTSVVPVGRYWARSAAETPQYRSGTTTSLHSGAIAGAGGSQAHLNTQPSLALTFVIALQGVYPSP
jgi:microcystin-dependent protein